MRAVIAVAAAVCAGGLLRAADPAAEPIDGKLLVGRWEPAARKAGELKSVEFTKDGTLVALADVAGKEVRAKGGYKLEGNALAFETAYAGETTKSAVTVLKLTADELECRDKEGRVDAYRRARPK
jgi:uncharacterized protein (TIGR03066 family)